MTDVSMPSVAFHDADTCPGDRTASGLASWLALAAAPIFGAIALWSAFFGAQPDMLCAAMQGSSPISSMTLMYLMMSVFHFSPWLRLISSQRDRSR